jgi:hypothetical protein
MGVTGQLIQTPGICALPAGDRGDSRKVGCSAFTPDNDPYGSAISDRSIAPGAIFWKIGYYDRRSPAAARIRATRANRAGPDNHARPNTDAPACSLPP